MDLGNNGQNNLGTWKPTLRVGGTMIGTLQSRVLRPQRQLKNFNMRLSVICDSRIGVLSNTSHLFQHERLDPSQRTITFGIDTAACETVVPANTLQHVGIWSTKTPYLDVRTALQAETKCMIKERGSCEPKMRQESQWPSRAEESTVDEPSWRSPT